MPNNTLTLALHGDVPLNLFAESMEHLTTLVSALSKEVAKADKIEWIIEDLRAGSARATVIGRAKSEASVERVVEAYATIGRALSLGTPIPYSDKVRREAIALTHILNGKIASVLFETEQIEYRVSTAYHEGLQSPQLQYAYGSVKGTVETLSMRRGHTFTLYDALFDKAVVCHLAPHHEEFMRDTWGKRAVVTGRVGRDPFSGHPVTVRSVTDIKILPPSEPGSYRKARGALAGQSGNERPEDTIRRMRDDF